MVLRPGGTFRTVGGGEGEAAVLGGRWAVWGRGMAKGVAEWGVRATAHRRVERVVPAAIQPDAAQMRPGRTARPPLPRDGVGRPPPPPVPAGVLPEGTHLWMRVERDASTSTLAGIGGLAGVHESFSLWSEPSLSSPASELAALAGAYSSSAGERGASVASCSGAAYFGTASNEYYRAGRCSMIREEEAEAGRG